MKMKSCVHFNYGYYGPKKGCMIGKECKCDEYERRSTAVKRRANHRSIMAAKAKNAPPLGISKGFVDSKYCTHQLVEKVDGIRILSCAYGSSIRILGNGCPKTCPYRRQP